MFFQSPRPFGQHSTSYRSIGSSSSMRSSTSMTNLEAPSLESGRASAPPADFASVYESSHLGPPPLSCPPANATSFGDTTSEQTEVSRGPCFIRVTKKKVVENSSGSDDVAGVPGLVSNRRVYQIHKTTSLQDAAAPVEDIDQNFSGPKIEVRVPAQIVTVVPVQCRFVPSQQPPPWVHPTQPQPDQAMPNVSPYHEDFQKRTFATSNRFRSSSAIPFNEYAPKNVMSQSSYPVPIFTSGRGSFQSIPEPASSFSETGVRNAAAQFIASQLPSSPAVDEQKPVVYQQLERRKNYATLHHVAPLKTAPLQRRISDPNLLKIDDRNAPTNIAMFNVAKGVKAELEQDPKFRRKADTFGSENERAAGGATFPSPPSKELPKQSPSLRQMENFFENVQQFRTVLGAKAPPPPPVPATKPFNVEHVRSIFRTSVAPKQPSITVTTSSAPSAANPSKPNSSILERAVNSVAEVQKAQGESTLNKTIESTQTFNITSKPVVTDVQNDATNNGRKAVEQDAHLVVETSGQNSQSKPSVIVAGKSVTVESREKSTESLKPKISSVPVFPQDVAILEQNYIVSSTSVAPRRLNQPFPVDESDKRAQLIASPPGILLKNGNGRMSNDSPTKTQKRVAFQCDSDAASSKAEMDKTSYEAPPSVAQYDDAVDEPLQRLHKQSAAIGGDLQVVDNKLSALFNEQRNFIWSAAGQKEPSANELQAKLGPIAKLMEEIATLKESKRNTPLFNHISAASEGVQALGWLTVKPTPAPFIKDMHEAAMFFLNRVLKEHKDEKAHTEWAKAWTDVLNALQKYVRMVHTTGLLWNSNPGTKPPASAKQTNSTAMLSDAPSGGPPAPPPPPPPPVLSPDLLAAASPGADAADKTNADRAALFAEINAGEEITKRLKKVTPDMQTHKNPALRTQHEPVPAATGKTGKAAAGGAAKTSSVSKQEDKPPKTWLENGKQWNVEYHKNDKNVIVEIGDMKQTVYVFKCENSVIQVKGKVNSITLDGCKKTSVVFDSLLSQIEVINCQSVQVQTLGAMPTLSIQKTDGCQVYLSKDAINAEIITSKSSEMNVLVPAAEDGDFIEFPVPEQFKTVYDGKKLQTTVSDIC